MLNVWPIIKICILHPVHFSFRINILIQIGTTWMGAITHFLTRSHLFFQLRVNIAIWLRSDCCVPSNSMFLNTRSNKYNILGWLFDPGAIFFMMIGSRVAWLRSGTNCTNPCLCSGQTTPKSQRCSTRQPLLYFRFATNVSSIWASIPKPPIGLIFKTRWLKQTHLM